LWEEGFEYVRVQGLGYRGRIKICGSRLVFQSTMHLLSFDKQASIKASKQHRYRYAETSKSAALIDIKCPSASHLVHTNNPTAKIRNPVQRGFSFWLGWERVPVS